MSELVRGERPGLTPSERWLRRISIFLAFLSLIVFPAIYINFGVFGRAEFPFAANSVAKDILLALAAMLVWWDVRRFASIAVPIIVLVHIVMPIILVATLLGENHQLIGATVTQSEFFTPERVRWGWFTADLMMVIVFSAVYYRASRSRYGIRFLPTAGFRALMALAEVLVLREDRTIAPAEVIGRVDHYLAGFRAREKYRIWLAMLVLAYWPLLLLRPPFHIMSPDMRQRWIQRRFLDEVHDWLVPRFWRETRRAVIRTAQQFCFMGYYGDADAAKRAGYVPFSEREHVTPPVARPRRPVKCLGAADIPGEELTTDVVIVGTGAAGALLAYKLAEAGRDVLMLERGAHIDPADFTENEATQLSNLYADGALTLTKDFRFQVVQGMCVGGSTVVNNAVCLDLPDDVAQRWNTEYDASLDLGRLTAASAWVREFLDIGEVQPPAALSPGGRRIVDGLPDGYAGGALKLVACNVADCLGCGYCNLGCAYGRKLSALDRTLPQAQHDFPGRVRILPDCRVEKLIMSGPRATGVKATHHDRRLTVRASTVVLSAGAIASSVILQRSGLGEGKAGRGLAFNMASPVTFDFDEPLNAEHGLQITHVLQPQDPRYAGLAFESWYNPIVSQSLFMPGWFEEHWANMRRYRNMTCLGVVTGTGNDGSVKSTWGGRGLKFDYVPSNDDFVRLKTGIKLACEIGLEVGARRVMPSTLRLVDIRKRGDLSRIDEEIGDNNDVSVNSAHPQGGNPISGDAHRGVVDPSFRVYGTQNVHVCDASVFPTSITVNPQMTVMALAAYAADEIG